MADTALRPDSVRANPETIPTDSIRDAPRPAPIVPAGPRTLADAATTPTRRGLLGAMAMAPAGIALAAAPATAIGYRFDTVMAHFWRSYHAYNNAPSDTPEAEEERLETVYSDAYDAMRNEPPQTHAQFTGKFIALWSDSGSPVRETVDHLLREAQRLAGEA